MEGTHEEIPQHLSIAVRQAEPSKARTRPHGRVRVFRNWCKGCGLCVAFCPQQVYELNEHHQPVALHQERCVACRWCAMHCPDFAIVVELVDPDKSGSAK